MVLVSWICHRAHAGRADKVFKKLQLVSAAMYSLGHGGNDAQKTIGIIWMLLLAANVADPAATRPDSWVIISCYVSMGLGTLFGGWRIVKTMGMKITKLIPIGGFCAETAGAMTLFFVSSAGIPVSTTQTITGAIMGVGSLNNKNSSVKWGVATRIVWAWVLTIPFTAALAAGIYFLLQWGKQYAI